MHRRRTIPFLVAANLIHRRWAGTGLPLLVAIRARLRLETLGRTGRCNGVAGLDTDRWFPCLRCDGDSRGLLDRPNQRRGKVRRGERQLAGKSATGTGDDLTPKDTAYLRLPMRTGRTLIGNPLRERLQALVTSEIAWRRPDFVAPNASFRRALDEVTAIVGCASTCLLSHAEPRHPIACVRRCPRRSGL